ncbi:MAG: asparagine synthase (glutamine-hydrolyzing) [Flavobacteriales bacterium]|nr:asparagine synthase (glutamine-hydrolyzing) [Flavobacteriales bacterium]
MCGIAGIAGLMGLEAPDALVKRMTDREAHRGPDAEGIWNGGDVVLGHRRLSIIDLSAASNQPLHSADGRFVIIFNGELYNYKELKAQLAHHAFVTGGDTEVVMAAHAEWGIDCLEKFHGMFAFALWDKQERELHIVRDRLGIKPVYLFEHDGHLLFASEIRALFATGLVPKELDTDGLADYLRYGTVHAPATLVKGVRMLMPGHRLRWRAGEVSTQRYWHLAANAQRSAAELSLPDVQREVRERLARAVEKRLVSDVPFGAFLSGGIDSSAVVGLMAQASTSPVHTFSVVFDEEAFSEERYAKLVAKRFHTEHTTIRLKPEDMLRFLPEALQAMDHPSVDGPNTWVVSKVTKEAGITMALSGLGGDELFAGYEVFSRTLGLLKKNWITAVPKPLRAMAGAAYKGARRTAAASKAAELLKVRSFAIEETYPLSRLAFTNSELRSFAPALKLPGNAVQDIVTELLNKEDGSSLPLLSQVSLAELSTYLQNVLLRDTDQMSMAHALEVRVPFLDHELVEFVLGVNDQHKFPHNPKQLLVDSLGDLLPREIVDRPKMGFTLPWEQWMKNDLKSFCEERLTKLGQRAEFDEAGVRHLWQRFLSGDKRVTWSRVWYLVVLADWIERNGIEV